jgi:G2/mitotic-specific cyclin-B, other
MRRILVDWLVEVHQKFCCSAETLFLSVNIMDRYLNIKVGVPRAEFQLVGVVALFIASKYEDMHPPEVKDLIYATARTYTAQQILDAELDILSHINFQLTVATGYPFLQRFLLVTSANRIMNYAATYYMERLLMEHDALRYRPSEIAAASVCLAINHPGLRSYCDNETGKPGIVCLFRSCSSPIVTFCRVCLGKEPNSQLFGHYFAAASTCRVHRIYCCSHP